MPRTSRATRRRDPEPQDANTTVVLDPEVIQTFVDEGGVFTPFDPSIPFFRALAMMTDTDWEQPLLYLYRLDPQVRNPEGSKKYIECVARPMDEEYVKQHHGGGKYQMYLRNDKNKPPLARSHIFEIDGLPKFLPGQTFPSGGNPSGPAQTQPTVLPPAPQSNNGSDTAEVVREVLRALKQQDPSSQLTFDMMSKTMSASVEVMKTSLIREAGSTTGNPMVDKMLDKLIENSLHQGKDSPRDSRMDKLMDLAVARLLDPPQQQEQKDPMQQLGFVKDLLGVESLADLMGAVKGGGSDWKGEAFKLVGGLATNLPALLSFFAQQGELNFRRQLAIIEARRNGGTPALQPPAATSPIQPGPGVAAGPIGVPTMAPQLDITQLALTDIVVFFDRGLDGKISAQLVRDKYPQLVEQLKPLLANEQQVLMFAQNAAPLNQIAGEAEFPDFMKEFCAEIMNPESDEAPEAS